MFRDSPDNRGAGVGYRCDDIDGQKTRDLPDVTGAAFIDGAVIAGSKKPLGVALDVGPYAFLRSSTGSERVFRHSPQSSATPRWRSSRLP
jgi:hypothetical protein